MKKNIWISVFTIIMVVIALFLIKWNQSKVSTFSLKDYQQRIEQFPSEEKVGPIETAKEAKRSAEKIWLKTWGNDIKSKKPYKVYYDGENCAWLVCGTMPIGMPGGVPYIIIQKDTGVILALWHEK